MKIAIIIAMISSIGTMVTPSKTDDVQQVHGPHPIITENSVVSEEMLRDMLYTIATRKGLPEGKIRQIEVVIEGMQPYNNLICPRGESGWNPKAVGDSGQSFGLVQIHAPSHPEISPEQSLDPVFALNFIVDEFIAGNEWKWSCWKAYFE